MKFIFDQIDKRYPVFQMIGKDSIFIEDGGTKIFGSCVMNKQNDEWKEAAAGVAAATKVSAVIANKKAPSSTQNGEKRYAALELELKEIKGCSFAYDLQFLSDKAAEILQKHGGMNVGIVTDQDQAEVEFLEQTLRDGLSMDGDNNIPQDN